MPLTPDSFRNDPRRRATVRALRGFWIEGRDKPVQEDEVVDLPYSDAVALVHSNAATIYQGDTPVGQRVKNPEREAREAALKEARCPTCGGSLAAAPAQPAKPAAATKQ